MRPLQSRWFLCLRSEEGGCSSIPTCVFTGEAAKIKYFVFWEVCLSVQISSWQHLCRNWNIVFSLRLVQQSPNRPLTSPISFSEASKSRKGGDAHERRLMLKQRDLIRVKAGNLHGTKRHRVITKITNMLLYKPWRATHLELFCILNFDWLT